MTAVPLPARLAAGRLLDPHHAARVKIDEATGCWIWTGARGPKGYGQLDKDKRRWLVHRYVWTQIHGEIPEGGYICHRCDNPPCCNPEHLFLGDALANVRDMISKGRDRNGQSNKTHCLRGHELSGDNLAIYPGHKGNPKRVCRICASANQRAIRNRSRVTCQHCGREMRKDSLPTHLADSCKGREARSA